MADGTGSRPSSGCPMRACRRGPGDPRVRALPQGRRDGRGRRADVRLLRGPRLRLRARRHPGMRRLRRHPHGRVPRAGAGRRARGARVDRGAALVGRRRRHDRPLVDGLQRRFRSLPPSAAAQGRDQRVLDRRPLWQRHPLHGRMRARCRHALVGDDDARLQRPAAPAGRCRRRLAGDLAAAHRGDAAVRRGLARAPATRRLLEARVGRRVLQHDRVPAADGRRLGRCYRSTVLRVLEGYDGPCKGIIGPWSHHYGFNGLPGPSIGFLQEALRWWDHWLKGEATGVMEEPALRAWMQESVRADADPGKDRPGRWVGRDAMAARGANAHDPRADARRARRGARGRRRAPSRSPARSSAASTPATGWALAGAIDVALEQRAEDGRSLVFDTPPLTERVEILGVPRARLAVSADQPQALLAPYDCATSRPEGLDARHARRAQPDAPREPRVRPIPSSPASSSPSRSSSTRSRTPSRPATASGSPSRRSTGRGLGRRPRWRS